MYFEAEIKKKKYKIEVKETKSHWVLKIQQGSDAQEEIQISKTDYTKFDDAISFLFTGKSYMLDLVPIKGGYTIYTGNSYRQITIHNDESLLHESLKGAGGLGSSDQLKAGMPGKIAKVFVKPGQRVATGGPLLIMEAMKMENEMKATHDCVIKNVHVSEGNSVDTGAVLVTFEAD
ncbi:MAG: acetyl-CoA carboxylase biotin carboxyl carrier protein subunit [Oligoflexia bacterium]|nr:acetyl-CoA carboxylase biotin carboxyl carrier protein subunit [Oligoflexia bacterium]